VAKKPAKAAVDTTVDDKRQYVVHMPAPVNDLAEWRRLYETLPEGEDQAARAIIPDGNGKLKFGDEPLQ
jgi:hypothetical protein